MIWNGFPNQKKYDVVLMDPPWLYYGNPNKDQAAGKHYPCVGYEDLKTLPVPSIIHDRSIVFCWTTSPKLEESINLVKEWGLSYRGVSFVWVKTRGDGRVIGGQGARPSITKSTTEYVLAFSLQEKGRPLELHDESVWQVVLAQRGRHSQKPESIQDRLDKMYPHALKIELFARRPRAGWECWGNEIEDQTPSARLNMESLYAATDLST